MIDAGSDAICILANFFEQFSLTDDERNDLLDVAMDQVAGRVPVIVTASHFSARVAAQRWRRAGARTLYEPWLPLIHYENRQCGLRATKVLMFDGGIIASEATRAPLPPLDPAIRGGLLDLADGWIRPSCAGKVGSAPTRSGVGQPASVRDRSGTTPGFSPSWRCSARHSHSRWARIARLA